MEKDYLMDGIKISKNKFILYIYINCINIMGQTNSSELINNSNLKPIDYSLTTNTQPEYPISLNLRCGPEHNKQKCDNKMCCNANGWCGGEVGKPSLWCSVNNGKNGAIDNGSGLYDA